MKQKHFNKESLNNININELVLDGEFFYIPFDLNYL